jgi:hypothetical protein
MQRGDIILRRGEGILQERGSQIKEGWGNTAGMWISTWGRVGNTAEGVIKLRKGNIARKVISNWGDEGESAGEGRGRL